MPSDQHQHAEAEDLRREIELLERQYRATGGYRSVSEHQFADALLDLLDKVDARDSLAWLIARDEKRSQLETEVERITAAQVAVCPDCGEVTRCDEDRCCLMCGRDLIVCADRTSAEVLLEALVAGVMRR